jgi:hypothetical protein
MPITPSDLRAISFFRTSKQEEGKEEEEEEEERAVNIRLCQDNSDLLSPSARSYSRRKERRNK